jgi:hypothetical protein
MANINSSAHAHARSAMLMPCDMREYSIDRPTPANSALFVSFASMFMFA